MQPSPIVFTRNTKEIYKQMENDEFDGEINDKELVVELLKFSTTPLLYMTEDIQKDIEFHRRAVKINGMVFAWDVCGREIILDAIKHPQGFRFLNSTWRNDEETASRAIQLYPGFFFIPTMIVTTLTQNG